MSRAYRDYIETLPDSAVADDGYEENYDTSTDANDVLQTRQREAQTQHKERYQALQPLVQSVPLPNMQPDSM